MNNPMPAGVARIHEFLDAWADRDAARPALRDAHSAFSYGELRAATIAAAQQLRSLGVRGGDRVVIVGENSAATGVLVLAASRIDAWFCVVNGRLSAREIDAIVSHAGTRRVVFTSHVSPEARQHAERHGAQVLQWDHLGELHVGPLDEAAVAEPYAASPQEQVAALIYTSGTSGAPKAVMLTHANIAFAASAMRPMRGLDRQDVVYGVLPMAHVVGLSTQFLGSLACGAALVLEPRFSPAAAIQAFEAGVTVFAGVPAMYARILEWLRETGRTLEAPKLRLISVAGSPLTETLKAEVESTFGLPLLNGYGLTECAPTVAQVAADAPRQDCAVGPPIPGVEVRLVGKDGGDVNAGEVGELWVRGPNIMKGYYRNEPLTREVVDAHGWFNTGDMARQDADGALHIAGRTKELIIRSGFNVYPIEIEQVLDSYPEVVQSAVVGRTVGHNEEVVAFVEVAAGKAIDEQALRQYLRARLSPYKQPAEIRFVQHLPAAPTGKVLKAVLKTMAAQGSASHES